MLSGGVQVNLMTSPPGSAPDVSQQKTHSFGPYLTLVYFPLLTEYLETAQPWTILLLLTINKACEYKIAGYLHSVDWSAGLECWNGLLEWSHWNEVNNWSGPVTTFGKVLGIFL